MVSARPGGAEPKEGPIVSDKHDLLNQAAREYKEFHEAIRGLNEAQMTEVWLGTWSIKEIVAHMTGWHRELAPALERIARGEKPIPNNVSYDDVDAWNAKFADAARPVAVADVLLEFDKSHEQFLRAADAVAEERFQPGRTTWKIVDQNTAHHYKEHGDQIRAWRAANDI